MSGEVSRTYSIMACLRTRRLTETTPMRSAASSTPGPNAPLSDGCGTSSQPLANAYAAVSSWTTAGMPANQIMLGVPAYGYLQLSSATSLRTRDSVTLKNAVGGVADGQIQYRSLVEQGALALDGSGRYV